MQRIREMNQAVEKKTVDESHDNNYNDNSDNADNNNKKKNNNTTTTTTREGVISSLYLELSLTPLSHERLVANAHELGTS